MNNTLDLPHLVRVCEAAAPGPWRYANYTIYDHRGDRIATIPEGCHYIANFIAIFNPSTVLALLRRLGEAEERIAQLEPREAALTYTLSRIKQVLQEAP